METLAVLLIFPLELEISGVAVQRIHENSERWLSQNDVDAVLATFFVMTTVPTLLRQCRRSLQIKKIIPNPLRVL